MTEEKKSLAIELQFDLQTIRKVMTLMNGESMTDEEIQAKFFDREPIKVDVDGDLEEGEALQIATIFCAIINAENKPNPEPKKSKFQERLERMERRMERRKRELKNEKGDRQKFRIGIIDFMPNFKKVEVGKYEDGTPACLGDTVKHNGEDWFIAYRYGDVMLKQVGMMAMIGMEDFKKGDFSRVEKTNIFGAGNDWLIIGYTDEPMYERLKDIEDIELLNE